MAYDEGVAEPLIAAYAAEPNAIEKKMFGGMAVMVNGHRSAGVVDESLMVRVGSDLFEEALARPHARQMDFTGRPYEGIRLR